MFKQPLKDWETALNVAGAKTQETHHVPRSPEVKQNLSIESLKNLMQNSKGNQKERR